MNEERIYYTYCYLREDGTPYYIGKGKGNRMFQKNHTFNPPSNPERILLLKENLTEEESFKHEKYMIHVFGRKNNNTGILRNLTDGGEGVSGFIPTDEYREVIREERRRRRWYNNGKRNTFTTNPPEGYVLGRLGINVGRKHNEETKQKMREKRLGVKPTPPSKEKLEEMKNRRWYNNGVEEIFTTTYPEGWLHGRLLSSLNTPNHRKMKQGINLLTP